MEDATRFFGAISSLIGVGTAIYSFLKARKEYHAAHDQNATAGEAGAAVAPPLGGIKTSTIAIAIGAVLFVVAGILLFMAAQSARHKSDRLKQQNDIKERYLKIAADADARGDTKAAEKAMRDMEEALKALETGTPAPMPKPDHTPTGENPVAPIGKSPMPKPK